MGLNKSNMSISETQTQRYATVVSFDKHFIKQPVLTASSPHCERSSHQSLASPRNPEGKWPAGATEGPNTDTVTDRHTVPFRDSRERCHPQSWQATESTLSEQIPALWSNREILSLDYCLTKTQRAANFHTHSVLAEQNTGRAWIVKIQSYACISRKQETEPLPFLSVRQKCE